VIAFVEICDECGTRYQSPALPPVASSLQAAMRVLEKHCPAPGKALHFVCLKCDPDAYAMISPLERDVWERAARRGRGGPRRARREQLSRRRAREVLVSQEGKKSTELIPGVPGLGAEDLLGMAAVCVMGYLFLKRPELARTALQMVDELFRPRAPAPPKGLPPVALETVQQRLEQLRGPALAKPRRRRRH
jgi:hypothetical protein